MIQLAVLGSTRGTHLQTLIEAIKQQELHARIQIVISNKADAVILERAAQHQIDCECIASKGLSREVYDAQISAYLQQRYQIDLIVLIGYMRILSSAFVTQWQNKIINVHPSLLPNFSGMMDLDVHRAVIAAGEKESGCTVHYVTQDVDAGPIILQKKCPVLSTDTPESLKSRVQAEEGSALIEAIRMIAGGSVMYGDPR